MGRVQETRDLGQSIWLDYIRRDLIESGALRELVEAGEIYGVTSNPSIFQSAIAGSELYSADVRRLAQAGWTPEQIFDRIAIDDIRSATEVFLPLYERTNGLDGYVSIEVNPDLAHDTQATLAEARRLWAEVNRPNVMIKIPATRAGIPAIEAAIDAGINVNVTLIFALERYAQVMEAYLRGLESRHARGEAIGHISSVASFFISRVDSAVDARLEAIVQGSGSNADRAASLRGKAAIANAQLAYAQFEGVFYTPRFTKLEGAGARFQRPLWASTSTKNPDYPDTYYVDTLIGLHTVNTVPQDTLDAFRDHGHPAPTLGDDISGARAQIQAIESLGIAMDDITADLEVDGVAKFSQAYSGLLETLSERAGEFRSEVTTLLPDIESQVDRLNSGDVGRRIWSHDASLWTTRSDEVDEVRNRLGWLQLPQSMKESIGALEQLAIDLRQRGIRQGILMGMGGSSLAPDVLRRTLGVKSDFNLIVLDSTDPEVVRSADKAADPSTTIYIVASKSGGTLEPLRLLDYFWARANEVLGEDAADHFIALTDPGSVLDELATERSFYKVISTPADVGGRFSALTPFGLFPAVLLGLNPGAFLDGAEKVARLSAPNSSPAANPGMYLGAVLAAAYQGGRDKLTFVADDELIPFADWIEQLVAESTGKSGRGLMPIVGEPPGTGKVYGVDRLLVYLRSSGDHDQRIKGWKAAGLPFVVLDLSMDERGFGAAFFQWEFATVVACHLMGVNAFNQPDVESAKSMSIDLLKRFEKKGELPKAGILYQDDSLTLRGDPGTIRSRAGSLQDIIGELLVQSQKKGALGLLLYLPQKPATEKALARLRRELRKELGIATLVGFGPRYLHSTGQIHKGGADRALFLVVTARRAKEVPIPGQSYGFAVLQDAQAVGDVQALKNAGRMTVHIELDHPKHLKSFLTQLSSGARDIPLQAGEDPE